jgi:hypothetical protein
MRKSLGLVLVAAFTVGAFGQGGSAPHTHPAKSHAGKSDVPAHHLTPPKKSANLPPILPKEQLWGPNFRHPVQTRSYELAAQLSSVLYQQPCYCYCDRGHGHTSLRSCFESTHGSHCAACIAEVFYAYKMTRQGKTPKQIRAGIIRGEWKNINLQTAAEESQRW